MAIETASRSTVSTITETLNKLDLRDAAHDMVVVGGSILAAYGIKSLSSTDLDIAVTERLGYHLGLDERWRRTEDEERAIISPERGISRQVSDGYSGHTTVRGDVTAITMPLDKIYPVTSDELIAEGLSVQDSPYLFTPIHRILDWKLALVASREYAGNKDKHQRDAKRISAYLLAQSKR